MKNTVINSNGIIGETREEYLARWSAFDSQRMLEYTTACFSNATNDVIDENPNNWKVREAREREKEEIKLSKERFAEVDCLKIGEQKAREREFAKAMNIKNFR